MLVLMTMLAASSATVPSRVLVAYHSETNWTHKLALEVASGASAAGAEVHMLSVENTTCDDLKWAEGIVVGSPVHNGGMASRVVKFFEDTQTVCFGWPSTAMENKIAGAFSTGGHLSDGKDATNAQILASMLALHMLPYTCYTGSCSIWGASATHPEGALPITTLQKDEIAAGRALGARVTTLIMGTRDLREGV